MAHDDRSMRELDLQPFVESTRRVLDRAAARRTEVPPAPAMPPRAPSRLVLWAAALVVLAGGTALVLGGVEAWQRSARATASEAPHTVEPSHGPQLVAPPDPAGVRGSDEPVAVEPVRPGGDAEGIETQATSEHDGKLGVDAAARRPKGHTTTSVDLAALDAEAQRKWKAGDTAGAEAAFREIIRLGGRGRYAELAFGDLFTLAHQAGDLRREQKLWRRYLARFPRGRFADDVRAWQCRRAAGPDAPRCWRRYLEDWPQGTHRLEAKRGGPTGEDSR